MDPRDFPEAPRDLRFSGESIPSSPRCAQSRSSSVFLLDMRIIYPPAVNKQSLILQQFNWFFISVLQLILLLSVQITKTPVTMRFHRPFQLSTSVVQRNNHLLLHKTAFLAAGIYPTHPRTKAHGQVEYCLCNKPTHMELNGHTLGRTGSRDKGQPA